MNRDYADELLELITAEPEHLVVLPTMRRKRLAGFARAPEAWVICHASIDDAGEYDLRPVAEVIGPGQRLRFGDYKNPLFNLTEKEDQ